MISWRSTWQETIASSPRIGPASTCPAGETMEEPPEAAINEESGRPSAPSLRIISRLCSSTVPAALITKTLFSYAAARETNWMTSLIGLVKKYGGQQAAWIVWPWLIKWNLAR
jgi:hypothetical protein